MSTSYESYPAKRVFAAEFNDGIHTFKESDEDRAPRFQLLPTGVRANRVLFAGTVTEIERVGDENNTVRARVVDPTGTVYIYAGQYEPDARSVLGNIDPPEYIIASGKANTFEIQGDDDSEGGETVVSLRPKDFVSITDSDTRQKWVRETTDHTLDRIEAASDDNPTVVDSKEKYGTEPVDYRDDVIKALESLDGGLDDDPREI